MGGETDGSGGPPTEVGIAFEVVRLLEPAITATERGPHGIAMFLDDAGVSEQIVDQDASAVLETIEDDVVGEGIDLIDAVTALVEDVDDADVESVRDLTSLDLEEVKATVDVEDAKAIFESAKGIYETIDALSDIDIEASNAGSLAEVILDYLIVTYLRRYRTDLHGLLTLTGVVVPHDDAPDEFRPEEFGEILDEPANAAADVINWGNENERFQAIVLLHELQKVMFDNRIPASRPPVTTDELETIADVPDVADLEEDSVAGFGEQLVVPIVGYIGENGSTEFGVKLIPVPANESGGDLPGLAAVTYGNLEAGTSTDLGDDWQASLEGAGELANRGVTARPSLDSGLEVDVVDTGEGTSNEDSFVMRTALKFTGADDEDGRTLLDVSVGSIALTSADIEVSFEYAGEALAVTVEFDCSGALTIDPEGGFLEEIIPQPITYDFDLLVGWSSVSGFYFENGGSLEASLPSNVDLGFLQVDETFVGIDTEAVSSEDAPGLPVSVGTTPTVELGFLTASVDRVGLRAVLSFPEGASGNLGFADLDVGFKPPSGVTLAVDAGPVTGGGGLAFYPEQNRYEGALQLQIGDIGLSAVGILETELPGGEDGYSLFLLITAEPPPIQLGFGFALTGIGGLLGINRQAKMDELGATVRTGSLDSVLFPEDVVENASQIISDLDTIFPAYADRHVVGPMARVAWGTPVLLTMKVGVILEIPSWKVAIAGICSLDLPDERAPVVDINMAIVGVIDIPNKRIAIDASLFDSRVAHYTLSGDMAMRLRWGDDSRFMLSVGGFHPIYEPPSTFPELDRARAEMSPPGGNPRLVMEGYVAVTPNTFQVGAQARLEASAGPAELEGEIGFDALFEFDPFKFVVDVFASLSVYVKGKGLTLKLDGTLSGPTPWHVQGEVEIDLFIISMTVDVDVTFGDDDAGESLPPSKVMEQLLDELERPENWSAQLPPGGDSLVTVTGSDADEDEDEPTVDEVLVHPLGDVSVRQTVVPLEFAIELFGNATPAEYEEFRIAELRVDGEPIENPRAVREQFAPAKFREMDDSEKLDSEPFIRRDAGVDAGASGLYYPDVEDDDSEFNYRTVGRLEYQTSVIDEQDDCYGTRLEDLGSHVALRPEQARFGVAQEKVPTLIEQTAAGKAYRDRIQYKDKRTVAYGVQGGTVIGSRPQPGYRAVDVQVTADTTVIDPDAIGEQSVPDQEGIWDVGVAQSVLLEEPDLGDSQLLSMSESGDHQERTTEGHRNRSDQLETDEDGPTLKSGTGVTTFGTPTTGGE